jgi:hypothetical protein
MITKDSSVSRTVGLRVNNAIYAALEDAFKQSDCLTISEYINKTLLRELRKQGYEIEIQRGHSGRKPKAKKGVKNVNIEVKPAQQD